MSLNEIKTIEKYGHTIGMHGFNHENFGKLSPNEISKIITEGLRIFEKYNIKTEHFAYPFGDKKVLILSQIKYCLSILDIYIQEFVDLIYQILIHLLYYLNVTLSQLMAETCFITRLV